MAPRLQFLGDRHVGEQVAQGAKCCQDNAFALIFACFRFGAGVSGAGYLCFHLTCREIFFVQSGWVPPPIVS
jgi:hypothetical protein